MNQSTMEYIDRLANNILILYEIRTPITNMENIVEMLGGKVKYTEEFDYFPTDDKVRKINNTSFTITIPNYSEYNNIKKKNYAIAKQLGHVLLHMGFKTNETIWKSQNYEDKSFTTFEQIIQANYFAMALIMPKNIFIKKYNSLLGKKNKIKILAKEFNATDIAIINRCNQLYI